MPPVGALLRRSLRTPLVFGSSTDVGKTIVTTLLCRAATARWGHERISYLKPVSTGSLDDADARHIIRYAPRVMAQTLYQYDSPKSPHSAARESEQLIPTDQELLAKIHHVADLSKTPGWLFIETAGGVHSPVPSGTTQADMYTPLRSPVILVGDSKLGGISQTISAFESLHLRGYDVASIALFRDDVYRNFEYLVDYFGEKYNIPVRTLATVPERELNDQLEQQNMQTYYKEQSQAVDVVNILERFDTCHRHRISDLEQMANRAHKHIWYPFTQQKHLSSDQINVIDSAHGDYFQMLHQSPEPGNLLQPSFDGSASWWTQGLGHANPKLTMAAAYASGRYGHVMFAGSIHEPALSLAENLLNNMHNPRFSRVFFSDNGSTGCEVAVKMALRAARTRYGWNSHAKLGILGLKGSYHGDTIGAMDCSEPGIFNEKVEWYEGKGYWFDYPTVKCTNGRWIVDVPETLKADLGEGKEYESPAKILDVDGREQAHEARRYEAYIEKVLKMLSRRGQKFGALMMEPIILGAGGMIFVDPLFQRALVHVVRRSAHLFGNSSGGSWRESIDWNGLPVVFDEVFSGLYRLGQYTSASFLGTHPDISVHAKLLTGGLIPLCTTLASESIFNAFSSDDKSDALLHGHSYTAHPVGCQVALESLNEMRQLDANGAWNAFKNRGWGECTTGGVQIWSVWSSEFVVHVSRQVTHVESIWALGSVLAITLKSGGSAGYKSTAAQELQSRMRQGSVDGSWSVNSRVLGNVFYIMASQTTTESTVTGIERLILKALSMG
ncbi:hypothetical protein B0I35DRAFT_434388 [Stachybotrys elegans]|uniref:Dethiobiotin synthase n=1 Tax=Stachybotrys elegans TaxID=80388 RepID=A0A8K0SVB0_9HYPO|nr:hypothetical protein B0I35DRAFT_434388 [Stachybotrys elegans]